MPEAAELADLLPDLWTEKSLSGKRVLITLGATFEAIDPVRGITNLSSGQMGAALARACRAAGADVSLVCGQMQTALPAGMGETVRVFGRGGNGTAQSCGACGIATYSFPLPPSPTTKYRTPPGKN